MLDSVLNNKRVQCTLTILLAVLTLFIVAKLVNEVISTKYIGGASTVNVITVSGEGEVLAVSDIATINVNLSEEASTSKEAQDILNESITKTLEYLSEQNIEEKDIKSEYGGLNPKYSYETYPCYSYPCPSRDPKVIGYTASQSINIKVRIVDSANEIRTGLADLGIKNISGPNFSIEDEDGLKEKARGLAIEDANKKAQLLAKQLGVRLVRVTNFYEGDNNYPMMYQDGMMKSEAVSSVAPAPQLPKGENKITSSVSITYEIK